MSPGTIEYDRIMAVLREIDRKHRHPGADMRFETYRLGEGRAWLRDLLDESDRAVAELRGSERLRACRRWGTPRHAGDVDRLLRGAPYFEPSLAFHRTESSPEPRIFFLIEELEYLVIGGRPDDELRWRPSRDELTFDEARAIAQMRAGTLYRHTSKGNVPGLIRRHLTDLSHTTELRFLTDEFMRWRKIVRPAGHEAMVWPRQPRSAVASHSSPPRK